MLTADLAQNWERGGRIKPRLINAQNAELLQTAADLLALVAAHVGEQRAALNDALDDYIGTGTDYRTLRGLIKLLLDRCEFAVAEGVAPEELRAALFLAAAAAPLSDAGKPLTLDEKIAAVTEHARRTEWRGAIVAQVAEEINVSPDALATSLYADLPERQLLANFEELGADELLQRYNLAQAQALFYRCVRMELRLEPRAAETRRNLFQTIKAYRLIHTVTPTPDGGYSVKLDGAVSLFHRSQKYGIQMAAFLPALLLHDGWQLRAEIEGKRGTVFYDLDSRQTELETYLPPTFNFTNDTLERLPLAWAKLKTAWMLEPTNELLHVGTTILVPDFVALHAETRQKIYLEVLGFWTPKDLSKRLAEMSAQNFTDFVMLVSDELRGSRDAPNNLPAHVLSYKTAPDARKILAALETVGTSHD